MPGLSHASNEQVMYERKVAHIVTRYRVVVDEIFLSGSDMSLENQITRLGAEIASIAAPVAYPVGATDAQRAAIDQFNSMQPHKEELQTRKDELQALYDKLSKVKV